MLGICSGFEFFLGFCRYIIHFHQSFNPMFATRNTSVNQITINPWAAVAPSACVMKISYFFNYLFILKRSAALRCCNPCIITAFAYIHYLAYPRYGKFITLFHNEFVFHSCAFVNMPTAFFRMSRSCFTIANSFFSLLISLKSSELMVSVLPALSSVSNSLFHRSKLSLDIPRSPDISSDVFPLVFNSFTASSLNSLLYLFLVDIVSLHDILIFGLTECPQYQGNFTSSKTGQAIAYTLKEWDKLIRYLDADFLTPDNNEIERAIRPFVIGRKNWLFSNAPRGAHASASMYSLVESAKVNRIEPYQGHAHPSV